MAHAQANPEVGQTVVADGIRTNVHDVGDGPPVVLIHGSGPGVSAWANWRLTIPALSERFRIVAPDIVGFGFTERPERFVYELSHWRQHLLALLDALGLEKVSIVGNSFGGALALSLAAHEPDRVSRLVLMGSVGVPFPLSAGLDAVWGYEPSVQAMASILDLFAYDRSLISDDLAELRYRASVRDGVQEAFSAMFAEPRQARLDALVTPEAQITALTQETLIIHGREDRVIPVATSHRLFELIERSQLHVFGRSGHWTQIEHTRRFVELVSGFLSEAGDETGRPAEGPL